jgi:hypothetical protein
MKTSYSNQVSMDDFIFVTVPNLIMLNNSTSIKLIGATTTHPQNHYGTRGLVSALKSLGADFYEKFGKPLMVNDMSLLNGGLFDINGDWTTPHVEHRDGTNADVRSAGMSNEERTWFRQAATDLGFGVLLHGDPQHWHLSFGARAKRRVGC